MKKTMRKTFGVFLSLLMLLSIFGVAAFAEDKRPVTMETVSYIDENGETQTVEAGVLEDGGQPYGAQGETNWYIIKGVSSVSDQVSFYDAQVNLIIADGAELTFGGNSRNLVCFNGSLRIYAQEAGTGKLTLTGHNRITSMYGDVQIIGGEITTEAITPDYMNGNGTLSIYGGTVNSKLMFGKYVFINGGTVEGQINDSTDTFRMTGGFLNSHTYSDIGSSIPLRAKNIEISGGTVVTEGQYGMYTPSGSISITGGDVTATANNVNSGMGISAPAITITGGKVSATSEKSFGIFSTGTVTFGADMPDTEITFNKPYPEATYVIKEGQTMTDGENDYTGTLTAEQVAAMSGVTLTLTCKHTYGDDEWTCFSADVHVRYCKVCGAPEYEAHDVIVRGGGDATCVDEGYTGDEFCSVCGQRLSEGEIIPPTGHHTTELVGAKEATATEDGYTGDEVCTVCGQTIKQGEVIPATGEATPDGPDDGDACPFCGKTHDGVFGWLIGFIHRILSIFKNSTDSIC
ncbi:MAG: hypothetical protein IK082_12860 [Oscillospiraceae bacterium]|nr:hypothetical protein [Oscillospiraceae bacterium]